MGWRNTVTTTVVAAICFMLSYAFPTPCQSVHVYGGRRYSPEVNQLERGAKCEMQAASRLFIVRLALSSTILAMLSRLDHVSEQLQAKTVADVDTPKCSLPRRVQWSCLDAIGVRKCTG